MYLNPTVPGVFLRERTPYVYLRYHHASRIPHVIPVTSSSPEPIISAHRITSIIYSSSRRLQSLLFMLLWPCTQKREQLAKCCSLYGAKWRFSGIGLVTSLHANTKDLNVDDQVVQRFIEPPTTEGLLYPQQGCLERVSTLLHAQVHLTGTRMLCVSSILSIWCIRYFPSLLLPLLCCSHWRRQLLLVKGTSLLHTPIDYYCICT